MAAKRKSQHVQPQISFWAWVAFTLMGLFVLLSPFNYGLFNGAGLHHVGQFAFERRLLIGIMAGAAAFLLSGIYLLNRQKWELKHLISVIGFLFPLIYVMASFNAASPYMAKLSVLLNLLLYGFFVLGVYLSDQKRALVILAYFIVTVGYLVVICSFAYQFGNAFLYDALQFTDNIRLGSFFTYPNGYAAFLLTVLIGNLLLLVKSTSQREALLHGSLLVPIVVSLLLTLSRGAILMIPVIAIITLLMVKLHRQIMMLIYLAIAFIVSVSLLSDFTARGIQSFNRAQQFITQNQPVKNLGLFQNGSIGGWARLFVASFIMAGIVYLAQRYVQPVVKRRSEVWTSKKGANFFVPGVLVVLSAIGFSSLASGALASFIPDAMRSRLNNLSLRTHSVLERLTIYQDALHIWRKFPILGGGGGAWESFYDRYQSYPYQSAQTHSYILQILLEVGIIGLILFVGLVLYVLFGYLRNFVKHKQEAEEEIHLFYFLIAVCVILHSLIDFEMSYGYFAVLVYFSLGIMAGRRNEPIFEERSVAFRQWFKRSTASVWMITGLIMFIIVGMMLSANSQYQKSNEAAKQQLSYEAILMPIEKGLKAAPSHPYLLDRLVDLHLQAYDQTKNPEELQLAVQSVQKIKQVEPYFVNLVRDEYLVLLRQGQPEKAISTLEKGTEMRPYQMSYYEQAMIERYNLWQVALKKMDEKTLIEQEKGITALYIKMNQRISGLADVPTEIIYNHPAISNKVRLVMGQVDFVAGQYAQAVEVLKPGIKDSLVNLDDKGVARFYIASLRKLGQDDPATYEKLIKSDSSAEGILKTMLK